MSPRGFLTLVAGAALMFGAAWLAAFILTKLGVYVPWPSWIPH